MLRYWGSDDVIKGETEPEVLSAALLTVETIDNHVYFYSEVNSDRCLALMRQLRELDQRLQWERVSRGLGLEFQVPIWLHINSEGGDLFAGLAVADQIQHIQTPIYSIIEGLGASAATIISVACPKRYIQPSAFMLVHQFRTWFVGKHEEFKDEMELQEMLIARLIEFYSGYTAVSQDDVREKLKRDFWMNAEKAVELGFADEILKVAEKA
ncbi:MAG: ATP-dependent Clp protease proteolytic subunit [Dehalococcoidia bacterium]|jgi:ATP-dependent protease ClpP protease subunit